MRIVRSKDDDKEMEEEAPVDLSGEDSASKHQVKKKFSGESTDLNKKSAVAPTASASEEVTTKNRGKEEEELATNMGSKDTLASVDAAANGAELELMDVAQIDQILPIAALCAFAVWILLFGFTYYITPRDEWVYLERRERDAGKLALFATIITLIFILIPHFLLIKPQRIRRGGLIFASVTVLLIAMSTNAALSFFPTVYKVDRITRSRVYLIRWCEWVPLSGLMTFLSEIVDLPRHKHNLRAPIFVSLCQTLSCFSGYLLPFFPSIMGWSVVMIFSFVTYLVMFPRLYYKHRKFKAATRGTSLLSIEKYDRIRFAYHLLFSCTCLWTVLVLMYFVNMYLHYFVLEEMDDITKGHSTAMLVDTFFDVLAKSVYMKIIVDVHSLVFDSGSRAQRQLGELRKLMATLWDKSLDVIIISVRNGTKATTMFSPSFPLLIGRMEENHHLIKSSSSKTTNQHPPSKALFLESTFADKSPDTYDLDGNTTAAYHVDSSSAAPLGSDSVILETVPDEEADRAMRLVAQAWSQMPEMMSKANNTTTSSRRKLASSTLVMHTMERIGNDDDSHGDDCHCEIKVSRQEHGLIAIVRDVTERHKRFDAEQRAHAACVARQRDVQAANRFTRHEVKNGLLASIEMCDSLRNSYVHDLEQLRSMIQSSSSEKATDGSWVSQNNRNQSRRYIEELDHMLHEILDTVLAEAMAREVVHEVYHPRLERLDVKSALMQAGGSEKSKSDRFSITCTVPQMPYLMLDPQMLQYIHRNAVSNACKYGRRDGRVDTKIGYNFETEMLTIDVVNEPGEAHDELVELGPIASDAVFQQGSRLHMHIQRHDSRMSSGDGAWIMRKCAKTMGGDCGIMFLSDRTIFTFSCRGEPLTVVEWSSACDFEVPSGTWGVAIDDSKIQRKLLSRMLTTHIGIDESRTIILGKDASDVDELGIVIKRLVAEDSENKIVVLVDENLDYGDAEGNESKHLMFSGSKKMEDVLSSMTEEKQRSRILALVRSANDSSDDLAIYAERTHGYFPKAPMKRERVREILAPLWADRFLATQYVEASPSTSEPLGEDDNMEQEVRHMVEGAVNIMDNALATDTVQAHWPSLLSTLHSLKGDLMVMDMPSSDMVSVVDMITDLRGDKPPLDLLPKWGKIKEKLQQATQAA